VTKPIGGAAIGHPGVDLVTQPGDRRVGQMTDDWVDTPIPAASESFMSTFASTVAATRRIAVLVVLAALAAVALLASGAFSASGSSTASPRWNTAHHVAGSKVALVKPASPRWN
jgi:hypothetical protein